MRIRHVTAYAPGRVNLIGDHTDYEGGWVLPCAIDRGTAVTITLDIYATAGTSPRFHFADLSPDDLEERELAIAILLRARTIATANGSRSLADLPVSDVAVTSTLPIGAGLSSSTALAAAALRCWDALAGTTRTARQCRSLISRVEHEATGVETGTMDQRVIVGAHADHAMLIDCENGRVNHVPVPRDLALLVVFSGKHRTLRNSRYVRRQAELAHIKAELGVTSLRGVLPSQVIAFPRAHHVVSENRRTLAAVRALKSDDLELFGSLMNASHASLRDDFEVSTHALDVIANSFQDAGAFGARMTGAGDGGCVIVALPRAEADVIAAVGRRAAEEILGTKLQSWRVNPVDGLAESNGL